MESYLTTKDTKINPQGAQGFKKYAVSYQQSAFRRKGHDIQINFLLAQLSFSILLNVITRIVNS